MATTFLLMHSILRKNQNILQKLLINTKTKQIQIFCTQKNNGLPNKKESQKFIKSMSKTGWSNGKKLESKMFFLTMEINPNLLIVKKMLNCHRKFTMIIKDKINRA